MFTENVKHIFANAKLKYIIKYINLKFKQNRHDTRM